MKTATISTTIVAINSIINTITCFTCVGNSLNVTIGLLSKLIQYIRFLLIHYPARLENVLLTQRTDMLNINIPPQIDQKIVADSIPAIFTRYGLEPSFLSNACGFMLTLLCCCGVWILCEGSIWCFQSAGKPWMSLSRAVLRRLSLSVRNFMVVKTYGGIGDISFLSVLEIRSVSLKSGWSYVSFFSSITFTMVALALIYLHCRFLIKYKQIKDKLHIDPSRVMKDLMNKYQSLRVLYEDLSDSSIIKHGFLLVLVMRDIITVLIITTSTSFPTFQTIVLFCCSALICIYVIFQNPFRERLEYISQIFLELCVLIVFSCALMLNALNSYDHYKTTSERMGVVIIVMNTTLNCGGAVIMSMKIISECCSAYKRYISEKKHKAQIMAESSILNKNSGELIPAHPLKNPNSPINSSHQRSVYDVISPTPNTPRGGLKRAHHKELKHLEESSDHKHDPHESQIVMPEQMAAQISKSHNPLAQFRVQRASRLKRASELGQNKQFSQDSNMPSSARIPMMLNEIDARSIFLDSYSALNTRRMSNLRLLAKRERMSVSSTSSKGEEGALVRERKMNS